MKPMMIAGAAAIAVIASASLAMAHVPSANTIRMVAPRATVSLTGTYPVTITHTQFNNGTGCLSLNGNGKGGSASLTFGSQSYPLGSFIVVDGLLVVTITEPLTGQNGALMFMAPSSHGNIGDGVFENVEGGANDGSGNVAFGSKNGC
ncbi:MAG: hypothetical protein JO060_09495 [Candidatus Eremiobacteraeota bacterium]|nr:hypothetical protein [Candidatus Eremiobacteraeota bacterium]